ncbi:MAG TPA: macro domain-containing protein [Thermoanaerobaculia bacterium]|jgi:O-acetyl-ADP-ribose deacetylase (regulator of RNase III)
MKIQLIRADISSIKVDAIVNPTNPQVQQAGGAGRLAMSARKADVEEVGLPVGTAAVTSGGNLLAKFVIHASIPRVGDGDEDAKLRAATWSALERAEELAVESVGLPAMGTGSYGFDLDRAAHVMLGATIDFRRRARSLQRAVFCLFGKEPFDAFDRALKELET